MHEINLYFLSIFSAQSATSGGQQQAASQASAAVPSATKSKNGDSSNTKNAISAALNAAQSAQRREDLRLTKLMLTIFLSFLVCFLPLMLVNVADDSVEFPFLHILASVLAWASAVVNPFIYAFKNRQYQQAFIKVNSIKHEINPRACDLQLQEWMLFFS